MAIKLSRHPELDLEKCVTNCGGNKYEMILIAAQRGREIAAKHSGNKAYSSPCVDALLEIQEGKIGREYLAKLRK